VSTTVALFGDDALSYARRSPMRPSRPPSIPPSIPPLSTGRSGSDGLADDIAQQRALLGDTNRIYMRLLAELESVLTGPNAASTIVDRVDRAWRERRFSAYYERPLVLLASMRTDAINTAERHPLARALANDEAPDESVISRATVLEAMNPDRLAFWLMLATRRIQTNEVGRAVAWRWPAVLAGCNDGARPLALVDVGASGGLNLIAERLPDHWVDANNSPIPVVRRPSIALRLGFDTHPLDFRDDEDVAWARACIWPGELSRLRRFDGAVQAFRSAAADEVQVRMQRMNATLVPARLPEILRSLRGDAVLFIMQTVVAAYMDAERRDAYQRAMRSFISSTPRGRVAWIELELDRAAPNEPLAALTAHVPDGDGGVHDLLLARCSYHPRELEVHAGAQLFQRAMAWR
jgi:hypothetical protein